MGSHYLFFRQKDAASFIDVLRPRQRSGDGRKRYDFEMRHEDRFNDLAFYVMHDGQRQRISGEARPAGENGPAIYTVSDVLTAQLVDFTSLKLENGVRAFRSDLFSPVRKAWFAYFTPYGSGRFKQQMKEQKGLDLEMIRFTDYKLGDPIESAVNGTFSTFDLAVLHNPVFQKYQGRGLALIVPGVLLEKDTRSAESEPQ